MPRLQDPSSGRAQNENLNSQKLVYTLVPVESARNLQVVAGELFVGLEVTVEPDKFVPGLPMKVAPILAVVDAGGNRVRSATPTTISCRIRGANQSLELFGTTIVLAFNGLEVFEGLGVNSTARQASFIFDSSVQLGSGGFVTSFPFDVSGPLRNLHLLSQTITARAGEVFSTDAVVRGFDKDGLIVPIDFGIMGRLDKMSKRFLAEILFGFIQRDYRKVAEVHFQAGLVPQDASKEEDEGPGRLPIAGQDKANPLSTGMTGNSKLEQPPSQQPTSAPSIKAACRTVRRDTV